MCLGVVLAEKMGPSGEESRKPVRERAVPAEVQELGTTLPRLQVTRLAF